MKKQIDKILLSPVWVQLLVLVVVVTVFGGIFFVFQENVSFKSETIEKIEQLGVKIDNGTKGEDALVSEPGAKDKIWYIICRLIDPGYLGDSNDKVYTLLLTIVGWIICGGFLIAIITNAYFERIKKLENGKVRYRFRKHCIIFGCNEMTPELIAQIYNWKGFDSNNPIVVHTDKDSKKVRVRLETHLEDRMEKRLYVFRGDRTSGEELSTLHLEHAAMVIVMNETDEPGSDSSNVDCFETAADIIRKKSADPKKGKIPFHVHFNELQTYQMAKDYNTPEELGQYVAFHPFNFYEQWARKVFINYASFLNREPEYSPLDQEAITKDCKKHVHLVILGYNRMGIALAVQAARLCHFPNAETTQITFIDKDATTGESEFRYLYPGIDTLYDVSIDFKNIDLFSEEARWFFQELSSDPDTLDYIAVCFNYPDFALKAGLNLPLEVYQNGTSVLIRQQKAHNLHQQSYPNIKYFGMLNHNLDLNDFRDKMASKANWTYMESQNDEDYRTKSEQEVWDGLPSVFKWANRYLVDSYPMKLRSLGLNIDNIGKGQSSEFISFDTEHRRWMAERVFSGWQYGEKRNDSLKIHHLLVPTNELNKKEIEKDSKLHNRVIKSIIELLKAKAEFPGESLEPQIYQKVKGVKAKELGKDMVVESLENTSLKGKTGEMLCKGVNDELWVMEKAKFYAKYVKQGTEKTDENGFSNYQPIPERSYVKALHLSTRREILTNEGKILYGKIGDVLVTGMESGQEKLDQWIVDPDIFLKSYLKKGN